MKEIDDALLQGVRSAYEKDREAQTLNSALAKTDLADLVESSWPTRIHGLDVDLIEKWKAQFDVDKS